MIQIGIKVTAQQAQVSGNRDQSLLAVLLLASHTVIKRHLLWKKYEANPIKPMSL